MVNSTILIVDDEHSMREVLSILFETSGYDVQTVGTAEDALAICRQSPPSVVLTDLNLPGVSGIELVAELKKQELNIPCVVLTAYGSTESAVEAMKVGAVNYVMKPWNNEELLLVVQRALGVQEIIRENAWLKNQQKHFGYLVGHSGAMLQVYELIRRVSHSKISCMILGESGTGKEMVARSIHAASPRKEAPFVALNCGAIPETLVESELFGHKKGAFTGAISDNMGYLQAASGGTIFLDEIDSLPLGTQVKLLRVLQEQKVTPVGAHQERSVDLRVLCASNTDLEGRVKDGQFREDLYYRLNVVEITLPPLRERGDDIELLAKFFLKQYSNDYGKSIVGIAPQAMQVLRMWSFPGNVRELKNLMERAVALCPANIIQPDDLPKTVQGDLHSLSIPKNPLRNLELTEAGLNLDELLSGIEKKWLIAALEKANGKKTKAAEYLHMSFRSFRYRLAKYGMDSDG